MLKENWGNFYADSFVDHESLNYLKGEEVREFTINLAPKLINFLAAIIFSSSLLVNFTQLLQFWKNTKFVGITYPFSKSEIGKDKQIKKINMN